MCSLEISILKQCAGEIKESESLAGRPAKELLQRSRRKGEDNRSSGNKEDEIKTE